MGGYISALATTAELSTKITGQMLLAPPISMSSTQRKIPSNISIFKIYIINLIRALTPKYRSVIVKEYVSFWYPSFIQSPHFFALRADNPQNIISQIKSTPSLSDMLNNFTIKTACFWGNKDSTLGIQGQLPKLYLDFVKNVSRGNIIFTYELLENLSHQFNIDSKRIIYVSADNEIIEKKINKFIDCAVAAKPF